MNRSNSSVLMMPARTTTGNGERHTPWGAELSFQAVGRTTAGVGAATVEIQVSNVPEPSVDGHWLTALEIVLTLGTTDTSDGQQIDACWRHARAKVTAISGTGANVDVYMGG
jgi:hypothetical protein